MQILRYKAHHTDSLNIYSTKLTYKLAHGQMKLDNDISD